MGCQNLRLQHLKMLFSPIQLYLTSGGERDDIVSSVPDMGWYLRVRKCVVRICPAKLSHVHCVQILLQSRSTSQFHVLFLLAVLPVPRMAILGHIFQGLSILRFVLSSLQLPSPNLRLQFPYFTVVPPLSLPSPYHFLLLFCCESFAHAFQRWCL